jgi:hypothetical protein
VIARKGTDRITSPQSPGGPIIKFKVIEENVLSHLQGQLEKSHASTFASAVLYAEAGLLDDAEAQLKKLLILNKQSAKSQEVVEQLLESLERMR